jgi:hypothetical protein
VTHAPLIGDFINSIGQFLPRRPFAIEAVTGP